MMKTILTGFSFLIISVCSFSQELDIFQNDSIYAKNNVSLRVMYLLQGRKKQKELVTYYNQRGQKKLQYRYWNGEKKFHNVQTFNYTSDGALTELIDSFADGNVERTKFVYEDNILKWRVTLDKKK